MADDIKGMYISNRHYRLASTTGHVIQFEKDVPKYVPPLVRKEAFAAGIVPVSNEEKVFEEKKVEVTPDPVGDERDLVIEAAMLEMRERNSANDFAATGLPKEAVLHEIVGFKVSSRERKEAWMRIQAKGNE